MNDMNDKITDKVVKAIVERNLIKKTNKEIKRRFLKAERNAATAASRLYVNKVMSPSIPTDPQTIFFTNFSGEFECNPGYICKELLKRNNNYKLIFAVWPKGKKQTKFLRDNLKMLEKAIGFLEKYTDFVLGKEEKEDRVKAELEKSYNKSNKDEIYKHSSYDLWEMNEGVHLYSLSAIYGAFNAMMKIYDEISDSFTNNRLKVDAIIQSKKKMQEEMNDIKSYILKNLYDDKKKVLVRNENDRLTDISIMGAVIPFEVFSPDDKIIKNTVEQINMTLRTYLGGYLRFQNDTYIGGNNPWIISTCWMGLYYAKIGNLREATKCLKFVVNSATELGLLAEQANSDLNEKWVIGLGWSHAMFIELLNTLYKKNKNLKDL